MLGIIGLKYVVMSEQEGGGEVRLTWRELNTTFGNNGRNLRETSKHQELSCGTRNRSICEMINFPMFYDFTRWSITDHTRELEAIPSLLLATREPGLCPGLV